MWGRVGGIAKRMFLCDLCGGFGGIVNRIFFVFCLGEFVELLIRCLCDVWGRFGVILRGCVCDLLGETWWNGKDIICVIYGG